MIYNRAKSTAAIYTTPDSYGEYGTRSEPEETGSCDIYITLYSQVQTNDARYKDVTHVGYTDTELSDNMYIEQDGTRYKVLLANNYARRCVAFLRAEV